MRDHPPAGPSRLWILVLRGALLLHPRRDRAEYGREIEEVFRARVARAYTVWGSAAARRATRVDPIEVLRAMV